MTTDVTATLADFAAGLKFEDIPEHVRENCRILLLDTLACALAGHLGEETPQIAAMASPPARAASAAPSAA
ncbi:MAG: MmgE/PrpD family protein, partial [Betaproteobacteria bacterium]|nr:MmgE/PrpD family protein [Betaproteobacteria bacterium]